MIRIAQGPGQGRRPGVPNGDRGAGHGGHGRPHLGAVPRGQPCYPHGGAV